MSKAIEVFKEELDLIKNPSIRDFTIDVIDTMAPDYFWTCPASTSGRYHPQVSLGEGGIIRHTKLAVWWGVELMRSIPYFDEKHDAYDAVIAALILHDLKKNGDKLVGRRPVIRGIVNTHGIRLADEIRMRKFPPGVKIPRVLLKVVDGIAHHMGRWTKPLPDSERMGLIVNQIVHCADYCASRRVDAKMEELMG